MHSIAQLSDQANWTHYTSKNGLPQNSVTDMVLDSGFLWVCTEAGVARFDGNRFRSYPVVDGVSIANKHFKIAANTYLHEKMLCAASGEVCDVKVNTLHLADTRKHALEYVFGIKGGVPSKEFLMRTLLPFSKILLDPGDVYPRILPTGRYSLLMAKGRQLLHFAAGKAPVAIALGNNICENLFQLQGNYYLTNQQHELFLIDLRHKSLYKKAWLGDYDEKKTTPENDLNIYWKYGDSIPVMISQGKVFLLTNTDHSNQIQAHIIADQIPVSAKVNHAVFDPWSGSVFLGTESKGLWVYRIPKLRSYISNEKQKGRNEIYYAITSPDSFMVISNYGRCFNPDGPMQSIAPLSKMNRESFVADNRGRVWYSISDSIFYYHLTEKRTHFVCRDPDNIITCFFYSGDTLWIGSYNHIAYLQGNQLITVYQFPKTFTEKPENLAMDPDGQIWFSTCQGIFQLTKTGSTYTALCKLENVCGRYIWFYQQMAFVATYGNGFWVSEGRGFHQMPVDENKHLAICHSFQVDRNNNLWVSTNNGLFTLPLIEIKRYLKDTTHLLTYQEFGEEDGMKSDEFNGGCFPNSLALKNGDLVFPSMEGLVFINPSKLLQHSSHARIYIDEIQIDRTPALFTTTLEPKPGAENIVIQLASAVTGNIINQPYEYQLSGYNKGWVRLPEGSFEIRFSNLPPGTYVLKVKRSGMREQEQILFTGLTINIPRKFYQTPFFWVLCALAAAAFGWILIRWYFYSLQRKNLLLTAQINEATHDLRILNDELNQHIEKLEASEQSLQQAVNLKTKLISIFTHDLISPLHYISLVSRKVLKNDELPQKEVLTEIQRTSERLFMGAQNTLNWIKYQNHQITVKKVTIAAYPFVQDIMDNIQEYMGGQGNSMDNQISPDDIIRSDKDILGFIVNNLLVNANKYCEHTLIQVTGEFQQERYAICIRDHGKGIPSSVLDRIQQIRLNQAIDLSGNASNQNGLGYIMIFEMARLIGADIQIESSPEKGTSVTILL